ncbi:MAG: GNAT family N-acetyltransferase [Bacillota bacterium]|nr:GNAT family N-acetyltransferase [Bacillota bacterium]
MKFLRPETEHQNDVFDYLEECFQHKEQNVVIEQSLLEQDYDNWLERIKKNESIGNGAWGRSYFFLCYEEDVFVGLLCIRYELDKELEKEYGNIGYHVRPTQRRKGYATKMLRYALDVCSQKGLKKVVLGCHKDNIASKTVIQKCGGKQKVFGDLNIYFEIAL